MGGNTGLQGAIHPRVGLQERAVAEIKSILAEEGVGDLPLGVDVAETSVFLELQKASVDVATASRSWPTRARSRAPTKSCC